MLNIVKYPNPVLKKTAEPVAKFDEGLKRFVEEMYETMYANYGIGLAAPQVAISWRLFVIDVSYKPTPEGLVDRNPMLLINPEITHCEGEITWEEGCLSCPSLVLPVKRSQKITAQYQDVEGQTQEIKVEDLQAVCIQHELDHLNGTTLIGRLTKEQLNLYKKKMERGELLRIEVKDAHHPTFSM